MMNRNDHRQDPLDELLDELLDQPAPEVSPAFVRATVAQALAARRPSPPLWWLSLPLAWRVGFVALLVLAPLAGSIAGRAAPTAGAARELAMRLDAAEVTAMDVRPVSGEVPR